MDDQTALATDNALTSEIRCVSSPKNKGSIVALPKEPKILADYLTSLSRS